MTDDRAGSDAPPAASDDADAAFAAVSDPTRIDILRALAADARETGDDVVGFAALRRRAGVEDPGRFRYHLNTLVGRFVEKVDGGYRLSPAGSEIVAAVLSGRFTDHEPLGPTTVGGACNVCGGDAVGVYEDGRIDVTCENDHPLLRWSIPPNAAVDATVEELATLATSLIRHAIDLSLQGVCAECYGSTTTRIERVESDGSTDADSENADSEDDDSESDPTPTFRADCGACGASLVGPAWFALTVHPTVDAFYHDHDRPVRDSLLWELGHVAYESTPAGDGGVVISVRLDDEVLHVTLSEAGAVVDTRVESTDP